MDIVRVILIELGGFVGQFAVLMALLTDIGILCKRFDIASFVRRQLLLAPSPNEYCIVSCIVESSAYSPFVSYTAIFVIVSLEISSIFAVPSASFIMKRIMQSERPPVPL